jgi:hypothetical protein
MGVRVRGLLVLLGSAVAGGALYFFQSGALLVAARGGVFGEVLKWVLALPLIGVGVGLVECTTGMPINKADESWQTLPAYVKYPGALVGSVLFLWAFLWIVVKALRA